MGGARKLKRGRAAKVDALRRAAVERPAPLSAEGSMAAYFRGFVAGAQRSEHESLRFEGLKDLIHRIAAERARKVRGLLYEDALSYAYTSALNYLRRSTPTDEVHFRKKAALAIRNGIKDGLRIYQTRPMIGNASFRARQRKTKPIFGHQFGMNQVGEGMEMELHAATETETEIEADALSAINRLKPRERVILSWLSQGLTHMEVGERLGITESRVCQIVKGIRERCGDELHAALTA